MHGPKYFPENGKSNEPFVRCPNGYHLVIEHYRRRPGKSSMVLEEEGVFVQSHCVKNPKRRR
ncbi:MAG: hypothetical protein ACYDAP_00335 [Thermoplasmataceae archaeon]|jgi:hypothetical protein